MTSRNFTPSAPADRPIGGPVDNQRSDVRLDDAQKITGLSKSELLSAVSDGRLRNPMRRGMRIIGWRRADIDAFVAAGGAR